MNLNPFSFFFHPSSLIPHPFVRVAGDFYVAPVFCDLNVTKVACIGDLPCASAADGGGRIAASNDYRCDEEAHLIDQTRIEKCARDRCAAFDKHALDGTAGEFLEHRQSVELLIRFTNNLYAH